MQLKQKSETYSFKCIKKRVKINVTNIQVKVSEQQEKNPRK